MMPMLRVRSRGTARLVAMGTDLPVVLDRWSTTGVRRPCGTGDVGSGDVAGASAARPSLDAQPGIGRGLGYGPSRYQR